RAPSMLDEIWAHGGDDDSLARSIRDGWPVNGMPPFKGVLSEQEIRAMVILIREARAKAQAGGQANSGFHSVDGVRVTSELHDFAFERVAGGLETPWGMAFLPDGRLLVAERAGRVRIVELGRGVVQSIANIPKVWAHQDGGLFDVAVHPDYAHTGWIYLSFSEAGGKVPDASSTRIIRGRIRDGALMDQQTLFQAAPELYTNSNIHFGSRFFFDPAGFLYFSIGDRGERTNAQDLHSPYGKLHRIRDDGTVPADNPFVGVPGAVASVWSYGHRNQQGISLNPVTGEIWTSEHGPRGGDEINRIARGKNYGWPVITYGMNDDGTPITELTAKEGMEQPVVYWTPSIAPSGIAFYTGDKFPKWRNQLFVAALAGKQLRRLEVVDNQVTHQEIVFRDFARVRTVINGPDGTLYIALNSAFENSPGEVVRLVPQ